MRKVKSALRIGVFIVLAFLGTLQAPNLQASAQSNISFEDWLVYKDENCGFSFQYPPDSFDLGDQGDAVRIGLPILSGTNLIEKYVDITCSTDSTSRDLNLPSVGEISNININEIDFQVQSGGEAGAGNLYQATKYSTQKENQYISLTFVLHSENGSNSGLPEFSETERDVFEEIMSTFKFSSSDSSTDASPDSSPASPPASPNFEGQIAYVGVDGNVYLLRGDTGETRQVTNDATTQEYYVGPAFDPNGENIAFMKSNSAGQGPLFIFNTNNLDLRKITDQAENRFQWYPDGSKLGYVQDGALFTFSLNDSNSQKALDDIAYFSWSPTGEKIIYTKYSDSENPCRGSYILDYQSQNLVKIEDGKGYSFGDWSPDGQWIVTVMVCYEFGGMVPVNAETGQLGDVFTSITSWSPDGTKFTGQTGGGYGSEMSPEPIFSGLESGTTKIIHGNVAAEWSPKEENLIATYGNDGFYFLLPNTQTYQKILDKEVTSVYWSPFGQQLLLIGAQPETTDNLMPSELMVYDKESDSMLLDNVFAGSKDGKVYVAWGKLSQAQTSYNISGNVSLSDQSPLPGVSIWVDGAQITTTDQSGNFRIDGVSAGQRIIEPRLDGYSFTPQSQQIDVQGDIENLQFVGQKVQPKTPLIIIPGVGGTRLINATGEELWPLLESAPCDLLSDSKLYDLVLETDGITDHVRLVTPDRILLNEPVKCYGVFIQNKDIYERTIASFIIAGYQLGDINNYKTGDNLFTFPYDWRKDVEQTATGSLLPFINTVLLKTGSTQVDIFAHSMGGLITRVALAKNESRGKIRKVLTLGTPVLGSPKTIALLEYKSMCFADLPYELGCVYNPNTLQDLLTNFPSTYQILPSPNFDQAIGAPLVIDWDSNDDGKTDGPQYYSGWGDIVASHRNSNLLEKSKDFHQTYDNLTLQDPSVQYVAAIGSGVPTPTQIWESKYCVLFICNTKYDPYWNPTGGDGTVPLSSASLFNPGRGFDLRNGMIIKTYDGVDHSSLATNYNVLLDAIAFYASKDNVYLDFPAHAVKALVNAPNDSGTDLNDPITLYVSTGNTYNNISFSAQVLEALAETSPVFGTEIEIIGSAKGYILDSSNNQSGQDETMGGLVTLNIPGSYYFNVGDTHSYYFQNPDNYRVNIKSTGDSPAQVQVSSYQSEKIQQVASFNVSETTGTAMSTNFETGQDLSTLRLSIDRGDDGIVDEVMPPTSINNTSTDMMLSNSQVVNDNSSGTLIGTLSTKDPDAGDIFTYSFTCAIEGVDDGSFAIINNNLNTVATAAFDSEKNYAICIRSTDSGGLFFDKNFTITFINATKQNLIYGGIAVGALFIIGMILSGALLWRWNKTTKRSRKIMKEPSKESSHTQQRIALAPPANNPGYPSVSSVEQQVNAAIELSKSGKYQESFSILKELVKVEPNNTQAWLYLGVDLVNLKDFVNAERCLQRAKKLGHPKADQALEWLKKKRA